VTAVADTVEHGPRDAFLAEEVVPPIEVEVGPDARGRLRRAPLRHPLEEEAGLLGLEVEKPELVFVKTLG
jgi:hypothetical protein